MEKKVGMTEDKKCTFINMLVTQNKTAEKKKKNKNKEVWKPLGMRSSVTTVQQSCRKINK